MNSVKEIIDALGIDATADDELKAKVLDAAIAADMMKAQKPDIGSMVIMGALGYQQIPASRHCNW